METPRPRKRAVLIAMAAVVAVCAGLVAGRRVWERPVERLVRQSHTNPQAGEAPPLFERVARATDTRGWVYDVAYCGPSP